MTRVDRMLFPGPMEQRRKGPPIDSAADVAVVVPRDRCSKIPTGYTGDDARSSMANKEQ